jgi:hypothetical protein
MDAMRACLPSLLAGLLAACGPAAAPKRPDAPPAAPAASAPAPTPQAIDLAQLEGRIVALGRNPEWRLDADAQLGMVLVMPEQGLTFSADFTAPQQEPNGVARLASAPLTLALAAEPCTLDGVSYKMSASAQVEQGEPLVGCAFVRWDWRLIEMLPAIDACLSVSPRTRRVTYAALEENGRALVRMHGEGAPPVDCRAPLTSGGPAIVTPTDPNLRIGGEGDAIFVRAPGQNPGGECYEAPEVRAADGALLGWMDDPLGC